jgi:hypothetical protein
MTVDEVEKLSEVFFFVSATDKKSQTIQFSCESFVNEKTHLKRFPERSVILPTILFRS